MERLMKGKRVKKIDIFGKPYEIMLINNLKDDRGNRVDGLHDPVGFIYIDSLCKGQDFWHTLIHELVHARDNRLSLVQTGIEENLFEIFADTIATLLVETFNVSWKE